MLPDSRILSEKYRPSIHLSPESGWINDPNGLVYFNHRYHQFYQFYPHDTVWGPMHWGHKTSVDLIHWEEAETALCPDDSGMCFSGSAIIDRDNTSGLFVDGQPGLLAFYTSFLPQTVSLPDGRSYEMGIQQQSLAYSQDGMSWQKYNDGVPIIKAKGNPDFRDPKVLWHKPSHAWIMVVACGQHLEFYRSTNLLDWQLVSEFGYFHGCHSSGPWECPDLFELPVEGGNGKKWVLVVGIGEGAHCGGAGTQYFIGDFDGLSFSNHNHFKDVLWLDYGRDYYATQSFSDVPDGRRIVSTWMNNHQYSLELPTVHFRGSMAFPRELFLFETPKGLRVGQRFVRELRQALKPEADLVVEQFAQQVLVTGRNSVVHCSFDLSLTEEQEVSLHLFDDQSLVFIFSQSGGALTVRSLRRGTCGRDRFDQHFPHDYSITLPVQSPFSIELLIDHGSTELLINGGEHSFTNLTFPENTEICIAAAADKGELNLANLQLSALKDDEHGR